MFKANPAQIYVPAKSQSIKPEAQVDYGRNVRNDPNQIRFLIPQYLGFIDPRETYLKYNFLMEGRGQYKPDFRAGFHSLIRDYRIQDGTGSATLEEVQDYNVLTANWWGYTGNKSINDKRDLMEGRSRTSDPAAQLFFGAKPNWADAATSATYDRKTIEALHPLYSGILSGEKVFPVVATQGLRLTMNLDLLNRSVVDTLNGLGDKENNVVLKVAKAVGDDAKAAADSEDSVTIKQPSDSPHGRGVNRSALPSDNNPFDIGDILYVADFTTGANEETLGVIQGFDKDGDGDLKIIYIPNRATGAGLTKVHAIDSHIFYKKEDRQKVNTFANVPAANVKNNVPVGYTISDLEMVCSVVSPPAEYVSKMVKQIQSSQGMSLDIKTYTNYRVNLTTKNGLTNQLIPATQQRAYSILSVPLANGLQSNLSVSSFQGDTTGQQDYQYVYGGSLIPDRPVQLQRYTQAVPKTEALHLIELEKALVNCGLLVRDLQQVPERFLIGRGFSKYGQVFNLMPRDLSLRVSYDGVGANDSEKLYDHFVCALRRIQISPAGIQVMF